MTSLPELFSYVQRSLFPQVAATCEEPLTAQHQELIWVLSVLRVEEVIAGPYRWHRVGVVPHDRRKLARAFVVKAWLGLAQNIDLRDRLRVDRTLRTLCGWQPGEALPSLSTFSRAFAEFAQSGLLDQLHAVRVREYLQAGVSLFVARDATALVVREKQAGTQADRPPRTAPRPKRPRGRPRGSKTRPREERHDPERRLVRQVTQTVAEAIAELPTHCGMGCKRHGCGLTTAWRGYKLHVDVIEHGIPIAALTTSAACHDSQVAIPLQRLSSARIRYCYELMDSGYAGSEIRQVADSLGHVALVAPPRLPKDALPCQGWADADRRRLFRARTHVERFNSQFKDTGGTRQFWVRGHAKVHATAMWAVLVVFAKQLLHLVC